MEQHNRRDVIVIGGGVSGLAAAYELERHNVSYTLIEVKSRLGGSIVTERSDGFVMDGGVFAFSPLEPWQTLHDLRLTGTLIEVPSQRSRARVAFMDGSQTLVDALARRLNGTLIQRMAVTSIGTNAESGGYDVCLENGLALSTRGVVVAVPARFAERMFRTLAPDVSDALLGYHYDEVTRVALGFTQATKPHNEPKPPPDTVFASLEYTEHPARVPDDGMLVQAAVRVSLDRTTPEALIASMCADMGWAQPAASLVRRWTESDPLTVRAPGWAALDLNQMLPQGVQLAGNCYEPLTLPERTEAGRAAARAVVATLNT